MSVVVLLFAVLASAIVFVVAAVVAAEWRHWWGAVGALTIVLLAPGVFALCTATAVLWLAVFGLIA